MKTARTHPDLDAQLDKLATRLRENKEALVNRAVREFVDREARRQGPLPTGRTHISWLCFVHNLISGGQSLRLAYAWDDDADLPGLVGEPAALERLPELEARQ